MVRKKKEIKSVDIIFCGLVRDMDSFKKTLEDLQLLRKKELVDKIIVSTWIGEVQKTPELSSFLKDKKVLVVESKEPENRGDGNVWCQMKSLQMGLKEVNQNKFVLKTRTDVYINPDFLEKLFSEKEKILRISYHLPKGDIFKYKIWAPWFEITKPFFMGDECFFGYKSDLNLLVNYDCSFDNENYLGPDTTHIRRFVYPFLKNYPSFNVYIKNYGNERFLKNFLMKKSYNLYDFLTRFMLLRNLSEINRFNVLKKRLKDDNFLRCLADYYIILYSHFYIDSYSFQNQILFKGNPKPILESNSSNLEDNFTRKMVLGGQLKGKFVKHGGQIYIYDMNFLRGLFEKKMNPSPLFNRLIKIIDELTSSEFKNPLPVII